MSDKPAVHAAIAAVMAEIQPVAKGRQNTQQNYRFRGIADVYAACQRVMAAKGLHITPHAIVGQIDSERKTSKGGALFVVRLTTQFRIYHADGSFVELMTVGEGMDSGDKAANKAMSAAMKYALIQAFCLPEDHPDEPENDSHEVAHRGESKAADPLDALRDAYKRCAAERGKEKAQSIMASRKAPADMDADEIAATVANLEYAINHPES
jgi:hypothetical protein